MKRFEVTINADGIRVLHENPYPLSDIQKFAAIMTLMGVVAFLGFFGLLTIS